MIKVTRRALTATLLLGSTALAPMLAPGTAAAQEREVNVLLFSMPSTRGLAALAEGVTPDRTITDQPINLDGYRPENYGGGFSGIVTMRLALTKRFSFSLFIFSTMGEPFDHTFSTPYLLMLLTRCDSFDADL